MNVAASREKGGTGLGLAIVKHILNRHRGELVISSKLGQGSTFSVAAAVRELDAELATSSAGMGSSRGLAVTRH